MLIEGLMATYEVPDEEVPESFREAVVQTKLAEDGVELAPNETVTEYIRREGFPYSVRPDWERDDN